MFIHLGGDTLVSTKSIVMIINLENKNKSNIINEFLQTAQEENFIKKLEGDNLKSMIVTNKSVYLSPISSMTLKKRAEYIDNLGENR
jgi:LEA14-like dessication related protein